MTTLPAPAATTAGPPSPAGPVLRALTAIEIRRLLRHPAPPIGLVLSAIAAWDAYAHRDWHGSAYQALQVAWGPLLLGISLAAAASARRGHEPLAEDAPVAPGVRALARLLAGLVPVAIVAVLTTAGALWMRTAGGLDLGDEPGRTSDAQYTLPELLQPVLLAAFAVAVGAAAGHLLRSRFSAPLVLLVGWFAAAGTYWVFNAPVLMAAAVIQVQPLTVPIGPISADPGAFPADWLLSEPNRYQDHWGRIVVSSEMAAWHGVYLVALTALAAAAVLPRPWRRPVAVTAVVVAVAAVVVQKLVQP